MHFKFDFRYLIVFIAWIFIIIKASTASMTHDESQSFYFLHNVNIFPYFFDANAWRSANNHWLNSLLFQISSSLFGHSSLAIRLFSVLSFLLYSHYIIKISNQFSSKYTQIVLVVIACMNPYVNDFFSTVRGYSFNLAFTTAMFYHFSKFLFDTSRKDLIFSMCYLFLSILSMWSSLIFIPVLYVIAMIYAFSFKQLGIVFSPVNILIVLFTLTIVAILSYVPITTLSHNEEFKWGAQKLSESFYSYVNNIGYTRRYMPDFKFSTGFLGMGIMMSILVYLYQATTKSFQIKSNQFSYIFLIAFLLFILFMILAKFLGGTLYPVDRKTTIYLPFIALILATGLNYIPDRIHKASLLLISGVFIFHFLKSASEYNYIHEWWYDRDTKNMVDIINNDAKTKSTIGSQWMFHPAIRHYSFTYYSDKLSKIESSHQIDTTTIYDYFICYGDDYNLLKNKYNILYQNSMGELILKKK